MRVLVTGHLGYIGPLVVSSLIENGHEVVGLDSGLFVECAVEPGPVVPTIYGDIREVKPEDLEGFDAIVHLAGLSNDPLGFIDPALTRDVNATATVRLAMMARDVGVRRFLNSSSCSVYGAPTEDWVDETSVLRPVTPYGESKVAAEQGLARLSTRSFCVVSFRNATAFGYSPRLRTDLVVNDLVAGAYLRGEIKLISDGSAWRPIVHVRDIAAAFLLGLVAPEASINGAVLNVGAEAQNYTVMEIARVVAGLIPEATLTAGAGAGKDKRSYRVRCDRIRTVLPGFHCAYDLRAGVEELLANFRRIDFRSAETCIRLRHLEKMLASQEVDASFRRRIKALA